MRKNCWILAAALLLIFGREAPAAPAPHYNIKTWTTETEEGLPQNSVIALAQTRDGYLWLGTLNGLARFDGDQFTVFDPGNTPGLDSSEIVKIFEDSQGNLWIGTATAGVALVKDGKLSRLNAGRSTREGRMMSICEDASGAVWFYTADGQLSRCVNGAVANSWRIGVDPSSRCRALIMEKGGPLRVGTDQHLCAIDPTAPLATGQFPAGQITTVTRLDFLLASRQGGYWRLADGRIQHWTANDMDRDLGPYPWKENTLVSSACEDEQGNLIVGTLGEGLFWFNNGPQATRLSADEGLSNDYILSLLMDREGTLWVGTDGGGLNRVKPQVFEVLDKTEGSTVQSVSEDNQGGLWLSTGLGINYWKDGVMDSVLVGLHVRSVLFVDSQQRVWAGIFTQGLFQLQPGSFPMPVPGADLVKGLISAIYQDHEGTLWVGTENGLARWDGHAWKLFTSANGLSANAVRAIAEDAAGNLWAGTVGGGLDRLRDGRFTAFRKQNDGLPSDDISSLYADADGVLWIGTGGGLARLQGDKWTCYTVRDGLVSDSVGYLAEDGRGYLWAGSNKGLMRVRKKDLNDFAAGSISFLPCRVYGKRDGLPASECTMGSQPGACRARDGKLWFPTIEGLASVDPAKLSVNTNPPPVIIESVSIEGRAVNTNRLRAVLAESVTVPAGKERLDIQVTSLNLGNPDRARFKYSLELEGRKPAWTEVGRPGLGNPPTVRYTKVPPGHYRFQVTACNEDGVWNETGAALVIVIEPPFWRTWWFLGASAGCFLGVIVAMVHYFSTQRLQRQLAGLRQQQALEKERQRIARDIHDQLGASLTQVAMLGEMAETDKDSPGDVEEHAQQISRTARETSHALDEIVWAVNPSNDTLDGLVTYFCKHAQEYLTVAGLRYRLDVPAQLPGTPIPPDVRHNVFLAAKESVTNVVKHAGASVVWIRLRIERDRFTLEIEDNGRGLAELDEKRAKTRNGLSNMRKRLEEIGGSFSIGPGLEGGTLVRLSAPLTKDKIDGAAGAG